MDPDWPGAWWHVACDAATLKPLADKVKGCPAVSADEPLADPSTCNAVAQTGSKKSVRKSGKQVVNLWRDVSTRPVSQHEGKWLPYPAYQRDVERRVVDILRRHNALPPIERREPDEDIPY